jgi:uncharacterized protein (DUF58 family)
MPRLQSDHRDFFSGRNVVVAIGCLMALWLILAPSTPAQAGLAAFIGVAAVWLFLISRRMLDGVQVERRHLPRVFQDDRLEVTLRVSRGEGPAIPMLQIEDQCMASLDIAQKALIPMLPSGWSVRMSYTRIADRHRGLYLLGPVWVRAGDPLGVFSEVRELEGCLTRLTIYPRADPLPDYRLPGLHPPVGSSLDMVPRLGVGEEVLGVREYVPGDAPSTVHWRTSARRGKLHVIQRNQAIQSELAVMIDLTRRSRFGTGGESTTELAIHAAISILSRVYEARHRGSLSYAHGTEVHLEPGMGLAHLHLLLDRLAILNPDGETDFWTMAGARALALGRGSRAVLISVAQTTPTATAEALVRRLVQRGLAVDCVTIDAHDFIRIWRDQEADMEERGVSFEAQNERLRLAGARVFPLRKGRPSPILRSTPDAELQTAARGRWH